MRVGMILFTLLSAAAAQAQRAAVAFIDAPSSQVVAGGTVQLHATAYDSNGNAITSAAFNWSVSNQAVLTVDSQGNIQASTLGWSDIYADTNGARATIRLQVVPLAITVTPANQTVHVGDTVQYAATALDINSQPLPNVTLSWRAYGANSNTNNGIAITPGGLASTFGFGTYFVEAFFSYTVVGGPFIQQFLGNTLLTVQEPALYTQTKLLDSTAVRQGFQLRERRGLMSVNDSGQIAYVGWLEGFATAALLWNAGAFTPVTVAGTPAELPGSNLVDIDDLALNNNGEVSTRCVVAPIRNCMLFGAQNGTANMILFDGSGGGSVTDLRNFQTTRFGLNDNSLTLFRADYENIGSTNLITGLFTTTANGAAYPAVTAGTPLPGLGTTYTFDRDFGICNDGTILFYATNGSSRALYRMTPDTTITRVIGTGDMLNGSPVVSLGNVAVGKNGQYATMANNGTQNILLFSGDPSQYSVLPTGYVNSIFAISSTGEAVFNASVNNIYALYRWDGKSVKAVVVPGAPSPDGDVYAQVDSAGFNGKGEVIAQTRTLNNLLLVVDAGAGTGGSQTIVFQSGAPVNTPAGPAFYNFVLNGHTGNPMIKTGWYSSDVLELAGGTLLPRFVNGDRMPDGWFYEGNDDVRRNGDGDLFVSTDQSITRVNASGSTLLAHFPQRGGGGTLYTGFQVAANSAGTVALVGGTSFNAQHLSILNNGVATPVAYLGGSGSYRTASPGGGYFQGSSDIGIDENGVLYANLTVNGGPNGLFSYTAAGGWTSVLKIGDPYDTRNVTGINSIRVAGTTCYAVIQTTAGLSHLAGYQNGAWTDIISYGDNIATGGVVSGIGSFDANRKGAVAVNIYGQGGIQYVIYINGADQRVAADNNHIISSSGELLMTFFQVSLNDDGRIFATAINDIDELVLYEFDPVS